LIHEANISSGYEKGLKEITNPATDDPTDIQFTKDSAIPSDSALKALAQEMDPVETQKLDLKIATGELSNTGKPAVGGQRVTRKGGVVMRHSSTRRRSKRDKTRSGARPRGYLNRTMRIKM